MLVHLVRDCTVSNGVKVSPLCALVLHNEPTPPKSPMLPDTKCRDDGATTKAETILQSSNCNLEEV